MSTTAKSWKTLAIDCYMAISRLKMNLAVDQRVMGLIPTSSMLFHLLNVGIMLKKHLVFTFCMWFANMVKRKSSTSMHKNNLITLLWSEWEFNSRSFDYEARTLLSYTDRKDFGIKISHFQLITPLLWSRGNLEWIRPPHYKRVKIQIIVRIWPYI